MEFTLFRPPPFAVILCKTFSITKKKNFHSYAVNISVDIHSLCLEVTHLQLTHFGHLYSEVFSKQKFYIIYIIYNIYNIIYNN